MFYIYGDVRSTQAIFLSTKAHPDNQNQSQNTIFESHHYENYQINHHCTAIYVYTFWLRFHSKPLSLGSQRSPYFDECQYQRSTTGKHGGLCW
ncbi:hypothetical protein THF5G08_10056 [Vibrio jasicida]|nr:hypothetical protein THF5G08_10056 [Vibrio jasicida]